MSFTRLLVVAAASLGLCGACTSAPGKVTFCNSRDGISFFSRAFTVDTVNRWYEAYDVGSPLTVLRTGHFQGITDPFPMMVPVKEVTKGKLPVGWTAGDYRFVASGTRNPDRIKVRAELRELSADRPGVRAHTLDYSYGAGVLSDTAEGELGGKRFVEVTYPCLGEKLDLLAL